MKKKEEKAERKKRKELAKEKGAEEVRNIVHVLNLQLIIIIVLANCKARIESKTALSTVQLYVTF